MSTQVLLCLDNVPLSSIKDQINLLQDIEKILQKKISDVFDLIAGSGLGGIIALMIANGLTLPEIESSLLKMNNYSFWNWLIPFRSNDQFYQSIFGDKKMSESKSKVMVVSTLIDNHPLFYTPKMIPYLFISYYTPLTYPLKNTCAPIFNGTYTSTFLQAAKATMSTSNYVYEQRTLKGEQYIENNPTEYATIEAKLLFPDDNLCIINIGSDLTNTDGAYENTKRWLQTIRHQDPLIFRLTPNNTYLLNRLKYYFNQINKYYSLLDIR